MYTQREVLRVYIKHACTTQTLGISMPVTIFVSPSNPGGMEALEMLVAQLKQVVYGRWCISDSARVETILVLYVEVRGNVLCSGFSMD